jgi:hypothetical protein
MKEGERLCKL